MIRRFWRWLVGEPAHPKHCTACEAREKTIALLADVVDWHRYQQGPTAQSASQTLKPVTPVPTFAPSGDPEHRLWKTDDEEEVYAAFESGDMTQEAAAAALQAIGAISTEVQVVRG